MAIGHGQPRRITSSPLSEALQKCLVTPEKISYPSKDDLEISAYIYAPPQRQPGERFPGLVLVHGGPTAQFWDTYQADVQYFIRKGYVVLMPNIRGSTGYGKAFEDMNNRDWGHGRDFVNAMWKILQMETPGDYVIGSGKSHTIRQLCEFAFHRVGIDIIWEGNDLNEKGEFIKGKVGKELNLEEGYEAAKRCALNIVAQCKKACSNDLSKIKSCIKVTGYVNSTDNFTDQPKIINGASDSVSYTHLTLPTNREV